MRTIMMTILSIGLYAFSCESQSPVDNDSEWLDVSALVIYAGDPAVDGCGWLIQHDQNTYSPVKLSADFKSDNLEIVLTYRVLNTTWNCGWREPGYSEIEILKIKKQ